jgi:hypothetical protein
MDDPERRRCGTFWFCHETHSEETAERIELYRSATLPGFTTPARGTSLANEINAAESSNHLIRTALTLESRPERELAKAAFIMIAAQCNGIEATLERDDWQRRSNGARRVSNRQSRFVDIQVVMVE